MVSLVYPTVYPTKLDGNESKDWRGPGRVFGFRPRPPLFTRPRVLLGFGGVLHCADTLQNL